MSKDKKIDSQRFYTLGEIAREELIPRMDTVQKLSNFVRIDRVTHNILKAQMVPRGVRGVMYKVRGSNIINWLAQNHD